MTEFLLHKAVQHWKGCVKVRRVFVGIEVTGSYHNAIYEALKKLGYEVSQVNSFITSCEYKKMLDFSKTENSRAWQTRLNSNSRRYSVLFPGFPPTHNEEGGATPNFS